MYFKIEVKHDMDLIECVQLITGHNRANYRIDANASSSKRPPQKKNKQNGIHNKLIKLDLHI